MSYKPGEQIREFVDTIGSSEAVDRAFELGFYKGKYTVDSRSTTSLRPELEQIRNAARTKWPNQVIITFEDIMNWVEVGAPDPLSDEKLMSTSPLDPQKRAVLLINNGLFEQHWSQG